MQISTAGGVEGRRYPSPLVKQDLAKLGKDAESRRAALGSLRTVIEEHLQGAALPCFLHQVEDSADGRRHAAAIVADLARVHGDRLPPHVPRLLQILAHTLLASAASPSLQSDCAKAVAAIAKHSASTPSSAEHVLRRLCLPLIALLPHKVELLSAGAAACLSALVESETWKFAPAPLVSKLCLRAAMALASRSAQTVPHMNLLRSLASVNASALAHFSIPLLRLLNHEILLSPCASWQVRLAAIHVMESLLKAAEQTSLASQLGVSLQTLAKCRLDKMPHVRKAATNALRTADALAAKVDMKQKLVEDLPQLHSQTEPSSPLHHSLESNGNIEDLFKTTLSSPRSQRSHALFLSPRTLADLAINSPAPGKQLDIQTPPSEHSPGRATTDDSDYFCAYFFDTKENVSCRKIVHHIHDTATGSATPPSSPPKQGRKVTVPPLPLSNVVHDSGQATKSSSINAQSQSAVSTPSSFTRHVTVLDSHAELLASCERTLIFAENSLNHQEPAARTQTNPEMGKVNSAEAPTVNFHRKSEAASDLEFIDNFAKSRIKQIYAEQRMHAMEDLQAISNRLLEIREGKEDEDEDVKRKIDWDQQQKQSSPEHQGRIQEAVGKQDEGQVNKNDASSCYTNSDEIPKQQQEDLKDSVGAEASSHHDTKESLTGKEEDAAETSSGEWSVRDNPIADGQLYHRPASEAQLNSSGKNNEEETGRNAACPITDAVTIEDHTPRNSAGMPQQKPMAAREDLNLEEYEEAEDEALESCQSEASESEDEGEIEKPETCHSSTTEPVEIGGREGALPHMSVCSIPSPSLRRFLMRSTACVIPGIAILTLAKLLHMALLPQHADSSDYFVPPT